MSDSGTSLQNGIQHLLKTLPDLRGKRFVLDATIVQDASASMSKAHPAMSNWIVPCYQNEWGHMFALSLPGESINTARPLYLLSFPGAEDIQEIDLLAYPWMFHELGHNLLLRHDQDFADMISSLLAKSIAQVRMRSIADRGSARSLALQKSEKLFDLWSPKSNHYDWSHELAADIIGLWICGPAYIETFLDAISDQSINPYLIQIEHPPYEIRAKTLANVCKELSWKTEAFALEAKLRAWKASKWIKNRDNTYLSLADYKIASPIASGILNYCQQINLPKCTQSEIVRNRESLTQGYLPDTAIDLILTARIAYNQFGREMYARWEHDVLTKVLSNLTQ